MPQLNSTGSPRAFGRLWEMISIKGALNESDLIPVARYATWKRSRLMKTMVGLGCLFALSGIGSVAVGQGLTALPVMLLGVIYGGYVLVSPRISIRKAIRMHTHVSEEGTYEFDAEKFSITRPSLQVSQPWSSIDSVVELKDQFAIFGDKVCFYAIPKRFFPNEEIEPFRELLEQVLQKNGKPFKSVGTSALTA